MWWLCVQRHRGEGVARLPSHPGSLPVYTVMEESVSPMGRAVLFFATLRVSQRRARGGARKKGARPENLFNLSHPLVRSATGE